VILTDFIFTFFHLDPANNSCKKARESFNLILCYCSQCL